MFSVNFSSNIQLLQIFKSRDKSVLWFCQISLKVVFVTLLLIWIKFDPNMDK